MILQSFLSAMVAVESTLMGINHQACVSVCFAWSSRNIISGSLLCHYICLIDLQILCFKKTSAPFQRVNMIHYKSLLEDDADADTEGYKHTSSLTDFNWIVNDGYINRIKIYIIGQY